MSKLEVKEIGPISGETDLKLGQSGGTVTLADGATAVGFGGGQVNSVVPGTNVTVDNTDPVNPIVNSIATPPTPNDLGIVKYVEFNRNNTYAINVWHLLSESQIQIPATGVYMVTVQTSWYRAGDMKSVRAAIYTSSVVTPILNGEDGRCLNNTHWYTAQGPSGNRGQNIASVTQRVFNGTAGNWVWLEILQDNSPNAALTFVSNSYIELVRLR